jgi:hypothetical protein
MDALILFFTLLLSVFCVLFYARGVKRKWPILRIGGLLSGLGAGLLISLNFDSRINHSSYFQVFLLLEELAFVCAFVLSIRILLMSLREDK